MNSGISDIVAIKTLCTSLARVSLTEKLAQVFTVMVNGSWAVF